MSTGLQRALPGKALLLAASLIAAYAMLEGCVRAWKLPDPELIGYVENGYRTGRLKDTRVESYGWDRDTVEYANRPGGARPFTALFVGDSVTAGFGLDDGSPYPELLAHALDDRMPVRVVNAAVQGYGIDQMLMKLECSAATYAPDVIVLAYIPHDLWRCGRNINYGLTKPVLVPGADDALRVIAAPSLDAFLDDYRSAKTWYHLSAWLFGHVFENRRYYFYAQHLDYYRALFELVRKRLVALSPEQPLLVVRLPSTWPGDALPVLDEIARTSFAPVSETSSYRFYDVEPCARTKAKAVDLDYSQEFKWHPQAAGHRILADCLAPEFERLAAVRAPR